jgi:hypothetical protein
MVDTVRVSLGLGCCANVNEGLFTQMSGGSYKECSVMPLPASLDQWREAHKTARKRADRAYARGYVVWDMRTAGGPAWDAINRSSSHRQGRRMAASYQSRSVVALVPESTCARHATRVTGVTAPNGDLVAYLVMLRHGDLALVSQILGHADHLENGVMWLLFEHALDREIAADKAGVVVYNRHDSGTDGLRWWKERAGFREEVVEWLP